MLQEIETPKMMKFKTSLDSFGSQSTKYFMNHNLTKKAN